MMKIVRKGHDWECKRKDDEDLEKYGLSEEVLSKYFVWKSLEEEGE